jgi:predicted RNA-binding protein
LCEAKAYLIKQEGEQELMEAVDEMVQNGDEITLSSIFGEKTTVKGRLVRFSLVNHKILILPKE